MKYFINIGLIISIAVVALFIIKDSDAFLLTAIGSIIASFFYGVFGIARQEELEYAKVN